MLTFSSAESGTAVSFGGGASGPFALAKPATGPMLNTSVRGIASATKPVILGFTITDTQRDVLVRVIGPSLAQFGVSDAAADTTLTLQTARLGTYSNDDWGSFTPQENILAGATAPLVKMGALTGAFPLGLESKDAAVYAKLPPGSYTVQGYSKSAMPAEVLLEVYVAP